MRMYDIIEKKQLGNALTEEEINFFVHGFTVGEIPDYQMSALLMAIYFQGMNGVEQAALTKAMVQSGEIIDLSQISGIKVDKHSTGGVGDNVSLIAMPIVASLGVPVAKMSGRGLGHTGGTIDKLESIPGFHVEMTNKQFYDLVNKNKLAIIGQSDKLTPADKKIYSLRDVTATVSSIPLIASSIMSKKIAAGADAIVLDVKTGAGAFMKDYASSKQLAEAMVTIGKQVNKTTVAIISDMSQPLGNAVGNALEVKEAIETLKGIGPKDLTEIVIKVASEMIVLANKTTNIDIAREMVKETLENGKALDMFYLFVQSQGGDAEIIYHPDQLPQAKYTHTIYAEQSGYISELIANEIGVAAMMLGAGRVTKDSVLDLSAGILLHKKVGETVKKDEPLLTLHYNTVSNENLTSIIKKINNSIRISSEKPEMNPLIYEIIR